MGKYLSKADFLAGITCQPVDFEVPNLGWVKLRSLTTLESGEMNKRYGGDGIAMMLFATQVGLIEPAFDASELEQLGQARPGVIQAISDRILELSGITDDKATQEDLEKKVGSGS